MAVDEDSETTRRWAAMRPELGNGTARLTSLSSTLWRLREALDHLLFKIFEAELLLKSNASHWLAKAGKELDAALQELRHVEVLRAVETVALADQLNEPADSTLRDLSERVPPPWNTILDEHRTALRSLVAGVEEAARRSPGGERDQSEDDLNVELVRRFITDALDNTRQVSLVAFLS